MSNDDGLEKNALGVRQPIVAVTGHVDHGKTSLLDLLRSIGDKGQTNVMNREEGGITQELGVTNVPASLMETAIASMPFKEKPNIEIPGLIFIDTPGHQSFGSIRNRSGGVADIGILIVDMVEGFKPQTVQSIKTLTSKGVPFVIVGNKIDRIHQWESKRGRSSWESWKNQSKDAQALADKKFYELLGEVAKHNYNITKYWEGLGNFDIENDRLFVPMSAKNGEGLQDLLFVLLFMAQHFARDDRIIDPNEMAEGYVLESREEVGLGKTVDVILTKGTAKVGNKVLYNTNTGIVNNHIRAIRVPSGMAEMRDAGNRWDSVKTASAARGLKLSIPDMQDILIGSQIFFPGEGEDTSDAVKLMNDETKRIRNATPIMCSVCKNVMARSHFFGSHKNPDADKTLFSEQCVYADELRVGAVVKARTVGGLEAVIDELAKRKIPISKAEVGPVNRSDIRMIQATEHEEHRFLIALSVEGNDQVRKELASSTKKGSTPRYNFIHSNLIYQIIEKIDDTIEAIRERASSSSGPVFMPGQVRYLTKYGMMNDDPALFGVHVLKGSLRVGQELLRNDGTGRTLGKIMSIGEDGQTIAREGEQVPVKMNIRFTRSKIVDDEEFWADVPSNDAKMMRHISLTESEKSAFDEIKKIHNHILEDRRYGFGWKL
ncbi:MAG: GTP-binding protein [Candidatus Poseidoniaceae archaeon]|nr:GTP-binding protein [Candidatus Poseidoniaceae archaeon]